MAEKIRGVTVTNAIIGMMVNWFVPDGYVIGYNVYRGLSNDGSFVQIATGLTVNFYFDQTAYQGQRTDYWYRVTAVDGMGEGPQSEGISDINVARRSKQSELNPIWRGTGGPDIARIMSQWVRRDELALRRDGSFCDIWILKTAGTRCSNCYDPARMQPKFDSCPLCFGTSYQGGYELFSSLLVKIEPYTSTRTLSEAGEKWNEIPRSWCSPYPPLKPGDVVVRKSNNVRYEVQGVGSKVVSDILIRQEFDLIEILRKENSGIYLLGAP